MLLSSFSLPNFSLPNFERNRDNNNNNFDNHYVSEDEFTYSDLSQTKLDFYKEIEKSILDKGIEPKNHDMCNTLIAELLYLDVISEIEVDLYYYFNDQKIYYNNFADMDFCVNSENEPCCFEIEN